jgi:hypothetical protein
MLRNSALESGGLQEVFSNNRVFGYRVWGLGNLNPKPYNYIVQ